MRATTRAKTWILGLALTAAAWGQKSEEYRVKAAFVFNFAKFVEWPPETLKTAGGSIAICVVGQNPFGGALDEVVAGKTVEGRTFVVHELSATQTTAGCQILFVSSSERKRLHSILGEIGTGVLTVGEADNFASEGGIINFKIEGGKVGLQVNLEAAGRARVRISSKLLSLAQIVKR